MNEEFQNSIRMVDNYQEGMELLMKYPKKYIFIDDRMGIEYKILEGSMQYYLPPRYKDSNIFLDIVAFAFQKKSYLVEPFNRM